LGAERTNAVFLVLSALVQNLQIKKQLEVNVPAMVERQLLVLVLRKRLQNVSKMSWSGGVCLSRVCGPSSGCVTSFVWMYWM
jgi:hypothetical protein